MDWMNIYGFIIIVLMLLPNLMYAYKNKNIENKCTNRIINIIEQIGRYCSMFLMIFNIGLLEFGFRLDSDFWIWLISIFTLLLLYWIFWFFYFKKPKIIFAMLLAIIPSAIFIFSGFILRHWLLVIFGVIFSFGHIYVTYHNNQVR